MLNKPLPKVSKRTKLSKEWHPTKNGKLKPSDVSLGSNRKVWWRCNKEKGHVWQAVINNRANGTGCPFCAGKAVHKGNVLSKVNPGVAREWHPTKNGKLRASDVSFGSNKYVWWQCGKDKRHEWQTKVTERGAGGKGCPYCAHSQVLPSSSLAALFPKLMQEWHKTKNGKLDPRKLGPHSNIYVWWHCKKDKQHIWQAEPNRRTKPSGSKCPYCTNRKVSTANSLLTMQPKLAKEWHPTKNGKLKPSNVVAGSHKIVWWQCKKSIEHEWQSAVRARIDHPGCPYCTRRRVCLSNSLLATNPKLAKQWHPTKNGKLKPSDVLAGADRKVWWRCAKSHNWYALVAARNRGSGCPYCAGVKKIKKS